MKLDTSHAHSEEAVNAMNDALTMPHADPIWVLSLLLTEWADDKDLLDISKFLENRLQAPIFNGDNEDECEEWSNRE